ncbi:MAG: AAA family ATPase, partial [Patulibacter sp.]
MPEQPAASAPNPAPNLRRVDVARMLVTQPRPLPWIVEPIAVRGEVTLLVGREGRGKSMLAQMLAMAVAEPASVTLPDGITATSGRVLIVDAENGPQLMHQRLHFAGLTDPTGYVVREAVGLDLRDPAHQQQLRNVIGAERPDLVILDALATLAPGIRENEAEQMAPWMAVVQRIARDTGTAVILLHHAGKGDGGANYRGSSAIGAGISIELALIAHEGDPDPQRRELRWGKVRPAPRPAPLWLRITSDDGRLRIEPTDPYTPTDTVTSTTGDLAQQMAAVLAERGELTWGTLCAEVERRPDDGTAKRARNQAVDAGLIAQGTARGKWRAVHAGQPSGHGPAHGPTTSNASGRAGHGPRELDGP